VWSISARGSKRWSLAFSSWKALSIPPPSVRVGRKLRFSEPISGTLHTRGPPLHQEAVEAALVTPPSSGYSTTAGESSMSDHRSEASLTRSSWSAQARLITGRNGGGTSIKDTDVKRTTVPVVVLALLVAACGGGSNAGVASLEDTATTSTTTAEGAAASTEEALLAFTECLREHGLEVDDPDFDGTGGFGFSIPGGGGVDGDSGAAGPDDDTRAAMEACQPLLEGIRGQFNDFDPSQLEDQLYAFAECMRDQGVDWRTGPDRLCPGRGAADQRPE
jgi:hypothetical protein